MRKDRSVHSSQTRALYDSRVKNHGKLSKEQRAETSKQISNSCREDYKSYFDNIINDMASAEAVGNLREVRRLIKHLVAKQLFRQP